MCLAMLMLCVASPSSKWLLADTMGLTSITNLHICVVFGNVNENAKQGITQQKKTLYIANVISKDPKQRSSDLSMESG